MLAVFRGHRVILVWSPTVVKAMDLTAFVLGLPGIMYILLL